MSDRIKNLLITTADIPGYMDRNRDSFLFSVKRDLRNALDGRGSNRIPKTISFKGSIKIKENLLPAGYDLMMYDLLLKEDFPPLRNDIMEISVDNIQRPGPKGVVKAALQQQIFFPGKHTITETLPHEIIAYIR